MIERALKQPARVVYSLRIANELKRQGFNFLGIGINPFHPQYKSFLFEDTPEFNDAFEKLVRR